MEQKQESLWGVGLPHSVAETGLLFHPFAAKTMHSREHPGVRHFCLLQPEPIL